MIYYCCSPPSDIMLTRRPPCSGLRVCPLMFEDTGFWANLTSCSCKSIHDSVQLVSKTWGFLGWIAEKPWRLTRWKWNYWSSGLLLPLQRAEKIMLVTDGKSSQRHRDDRHAVCLSQEELGLHRSFVQKPRWQILTFLQETRCDWGSQRVDDLIFRSDSQQQSNTLDLVQFLADWMTHTVSCWFWLI